jgi:HAD superfamily hydrolase (TIGR01549 family)
LFDLDGTLVDSVYQHVLAWHQALGEEGIHLSVWRIHRRIGMSGGLFTSILARETGIEPDPARLARILRRHHEIYVEHIDEVVALPGARELLQALSAAKLPWAIATSGRMETARVSIELLGIPFDRLVLVTRDQVHHAKPDPDLFVAGAERLGLAMNHATIVGDSVWDMLAAQRARGLGVGLLSGGYGAEELERAGAYRVFADPADMLAHLDEIGGRR